MPVQGRVSGGHCTCYARVRARVYAYVVERDERKERWVEREKERVGRGVDGAERVERKKTKKENKKEKKKEKEKEKEKRKKNSPHSHSHSWAGLLHTLQWSDFGRVLAAQGSLGMCFRYPDILAHSSCEGEWSKRVGVGVEEEWRGGGRGGEGERG